MILLLVKLGLKLLPFQLFLKILHPLLQCFLRRYLYFLQRNDILFDLLPHIHHDHQLIITTHNQLLLIQVDHQLVKLFSVIGDFPEMTGQTGIAETAEVDPVLQGMRYVYDERTLDQLQTSIETTTDLPLRLIHQIW